jgi:hypothetical protein
LICTADIAPKAAEDIALRSDDVSVAACADVIAWTLAAVSEPAAAVVNGQTTKDALETVVMTIPFAAPRRSRNTLRRGGGEGRRHDASQSRLKCAMLNVCILRHRIRRSNDTKFTR